jgi:tetratricopeptide (TPR) repeat protein
VPAKKRAPGGSSASRSAWALLEKGFGLRDADRHDEALAVFDEFVARIGHDPDPKVQRAVAQAQLDKGLVLDGLGRHAEEIAVYDELVARHREAAAPAIRELVAWALYNRAWTLSSLNRSVEAIASFREVSGRFADAEEPPLRERVNWALWQEGSLLHDAGRLDEAAAVFDRLIDRRSDPFTPDLAERVVWAMSTRADRRRGAGRHEEAIADYEAIVERFGADPEPRVQKHVVDARELVGVELATAGRHEDALHAYDDALVALAGAPSVESRRTAVRLYANKGIELRASGRNEEAALAFGASIAAGRELVDQTGARETHVLVTAVEAALSELDALRETGDTASMILVPGQIAALVGVETAEPGLDPVLEREPEERLAALLAETHTAETWLELAVAGDDPATRERLAARATELYRRTAPWLAVDVEEWQAPWFGAVTVLRNIADCLAMLSWESTAAERARLPLTMRELAESALRELEVDEWAAELGHPLALSAPSGRSTICSATCAAPAGTQTGSRRSARRSPRPPRSTTSFLRWPARRRVARRSPATASSATRSCESGTRGVGRPGSACTSRKPPEPPRPCSSWHRPCSSPRGAR